MSTVTLITAEQLFATPDDGQRRELTDGELVMMAPASGGHGEIASALGSWLYMHVRSHGLGKVYAAETGFILSRNPDTVLAPDVAFVSRERLPAGGLPYRGFVPFAPDLAAEVLSPDDRQVDVEEKIQRWLDAGTKAVWIINPQRRTVTVHRSSRDPRMLREADVLLGEDVVPGFELKVAELFV